MKFEPGSLRKAVIKISTEAAEYAGGIEVCITKCHHLKDPPGKNRENPKRRCCSCCKPNYLTVEQRKIAKEETGIVPTEDRGFWGPKGCRLPRSHRPTMCLLFSCHTMREEAPRAAGMLWAGQLVHSNPDDWSK